MTREATPATWFPDGKLNAERVSELSGIMIKVAREMGFSRETYAAAIAQSAEGITGLPTELDIDPDVQRFVGERLLAVGAALTVVN